MMPTVRRLKTRSQFLKIAASGHKWVTPGLILQARCRVRPKQPAPPPADEATNDCATVGFTVSRKVGGAVQRNRARRRLRAAAAEILTHHAQSGWDYVLIGRKTTLQRPFEELKRDLRTALRKIRPNETARPSLASDRGPGSGGEA